VWNVPLLLKERRPVQQEMNGNMSSTRNVFDAARNNIDSAGERRTTTTLYYALMLVINTSQNMESSRGVETATRLTRDTSFSNEVSQIVSANRKALFGPNDLPSHSISLSSHMKPLNVAFSSPFPFKIRCTKECRVALGTDMEQEYGPGK
jgi:hypothetical protein